jgi:DmsE family decaheme c-type cytochrome
MTRSSRWWTGALASGFALSVFPMLAVRSASTEAPAASPAQESAGYAGSEACLTCHEEQGHTLVHPHPDAQDPRCESCHGPGKAHADAGGDPNLMESFQELAARRADERCQSCHAGQEQRFWTGSPHARSQVRCTGCHAVHDAEGPDGKKPSLLRAGGEMATCFGCHGTLRTQIWKSSHMPVREGKLACADCHNPHGSAAERMLRDASVQENCYRCHADKRGPVLFEHPPVRENCLNCHNAHGSMHENLLVTRPPRLCQNCHINSRHPGEPRSVTGPGSRFAFNKACANCHIQVHGSNHPAGVRQQR